MSIPRGLSVEEASAWAKLASTVTPFEGRAMPKDEPNSSARPVKVDPPRPAFQPGTQSAVPKSSTQSRSTAGPPPGLDGHWDRKLKAGAISPDYTLDLHGHTLDQAYDRLMSGLDQAISMEARVVLLIAGRSRPVDPADRGKKRGAIRAKILDWLAASRHENSIAAVRRAHIRHGGEGALYLVLKRKR